jgi:hypothetical protein
MRAVLSKAIAVVAGATLLTGLAASPGWAARPDQTGKHLEFEHWHDQATFSSADLEDWACQDLGFDVIITIDVRGLAMLSPRGRDGIAYYTGTARGTVSWSANGHTFSNVFSIVDKDQRVELHPDDPSRLLITVLAAGGGAWYLDGTRLFRDPGMTKYQFSIEHAGTPADPFDDPEDTWRFEGVVQGSTGLNEMEGRDFCEDLATFLAH